MVFYNLWRPGGSHHVVVIVIIAQNCPLLSLGVNNVCCWKYTGEFQWHFKWLPKNNTMVYAEIKNVILVPKEREKEKQGKIV